MGVLLCRPTRKLSCSSRFRASMGSFGHVFVKYVVLLRDIPCKNSSAASTDAVPRPTLAKLRGTLLSSEKQLISRDKSFTFFVAL